MLRNGLAKLVRLVVKGSELLVNGVMFKEWMRASEGV